MQGDSYAAGWSALSKSLRRGFSWSGNERNCAFLNLGEGAARFADVSAVSGLDLDHDARAAISIDWDHDGDLDLWLASRSAPRLRLLSNELTQRPSIALRPVGTRSNRDGVGARVELTLGGEQERKLARVRRAGDGILAQGGAWLFFGIGEREIASCTVTWPGGEREAFTGLRPGARLDLVEGTGRARRSAGAGAGERTLVAKPLQAQAQTKASGGTRVVLRSPRPIPTLTLETTGGERARFLGPGHGTGTDRSLLLVLWADWCAPCIAELQDLARHARDLRAAGVDVVAISVDQADGRDRAVKRLEQLEWPFASGFATPEAISTLDVLAGSILDTEERLSLPSSFLIQPSGELVALYRGPAYAARVAIDAGALVDLDPAERLKAATPLPGRWARDPVEVDLGYLAGRFQRRGLPAASRELELAQVQVRELNALEFQIALGDARLEQGDLDGAIAAFGAALEADPYSARALGQLGFARHRKGELDAARDAYQRALALDGSAHNVRYNLGLALASAGLFEKAREQAAKLRSRGSGLAERLSAALEVAESRRAVDTGEAVDPDDPGEN